MRASGILMPIFSLPSKYGIGTFSKEAREFVDQLFEARQKFWQVLPLGPTSFGDSPYQSFSSFAGNPYFIDMDELYNEGLLMKDELPKQQEKYTNGPTYINYELLYKTRYHILRKAYQRFDKNTTSFHQFQLENDYWLKGYSSFMAIKNYYKDQDMYHWDIKIRKRETDALNHMLQVCEEEIGFYEFLQFKFMEQWDKLHQYANSKGIQIIGDIPIYVAFDSADCWNSPELFQLDKDLKPIAVAGCPPDFFAKTGQLWGNPLYQWEYHKETNYEWWVNRIRHSLKLYDSVRIDHFRGFDEYYSIPYGDKTAEHGTWIKGPGIDLFHCLNKQIGKKVEFENQFNFSELKTQSNFSEMNNKFDCDKSESNAAGQELSIIAEDLGFLTDSVIQLLNESGYPGMKILQFAFDSREDSNYIPHTYSKNCVVYTGTHDNDTIIGWLESIHKEDCEYALTYLGIDKNKPEVHWDFIRLGMASVADTAIFPIQDYLGLGSKARINIPSTLGNNWRWRLLPNELTPDIISKIGQMTKLYGRANKLIPSVVCETKEQDYSKQA
ncbi:MAG: 4-alpha-glucanotransferase [Mobilitalea sp.]